MPLPTPAPRTEPAMSASPFPRPAPGVTAAPAASGPARVAYVMNGFPRLSETFIAHEIHQLEQLGMGLRLFSVKRENEPQVHPVVAQIRAPLQYLPRVSSLSGSTLWGWLRQNAPTYAAAHRAVARRHPIRWATTAAAALGLALRHGSRDGRFGFRLRKIFVKEFLQAGHIAAEVMQDHDVGHLHGHFCHGVATITWFASRMTGLPYSFTAHAKDIYQPDLNPGRLLERKMAGARFVATCTCANAEVLRRRHARPEEVHAIYHGLDTDVFRPPARRAETDAEPPLILSVGRFVEKKGFEHLVRACARLRESAIPFRCAIVGEDGPARVGIEALVSELGLQAHVELHPPMTQDRLRHLYARAHVFALPCQVMADGDRDGFPNVLAEAMAMGVPVVSTAISGIPEMIDDGVHGLLVRERDPRALAIALARLLLDPTQHAAIAAAGRQRMVERFDARTTTVALRDLLAAQLRAPAGAGAGPAAGQPARA